jgi:uncharacterized membrane protein YheB (UPF0754 family)
VHALLADFSRHWLLYSTMPVIAALIGYVTKRVAIAMMYHPLEFAGLPGTPIGWQGVLPRNATRMSTIAMDLLLGDLIDPKEIFSRIDPERISQKVAGPLYAAVDEITRDVLEDYEPQLWELLPERAQQVVLDRVHAGVPEAVRTLLEDIRYDIESVIDVRAMAISACVRDKALLNRLLRQIADPEMRFIARSGIYFGFLIGLVQMLTWAATKQPLVLPAFGLCVGWLTDWLALKMIFLPRAPLRLAGPITLQGKFQRRREQVARDYGKLIADEVLTVDNVVEAALTGPRSDRLLAMIERQVGLTVDAQVGAVKPIVALGLGPARLHAMKREAARKAIQRVPEAVSSVEGYARRALDVRGSIVRGVRALSPLQYEKLLRPAFRQDEWKLIGLGALIGFGVGELQTLLVLHV